MLTKAGSVQLAGFGAGTPRSLYCAYRVTGPATNYSAIATLGTATPRIQINSATSPAQWYGLITNGPTISLGGLNTVGLRVACLWISSTTLMQVTGLGLGRGQTAIVGDTLENDPTLTLASQSYCVGLIAAAYPASHTAYQRVHIMAKLLHLAGGGAGFVACLPAAGLISGWRHEGASAGLPGSAAAQPGSHGLTDVCRAQLSGVSRSRLDRAVRHAAEPVRMGCVCGWCTQARLADYPGRCAAAAACLGTCGRTGACRDYDSDSSIGYRRPNRAVMDCRESRYGVAADRFRAGHSGRCAVDVLSELDFSGRRRGSGVAGSVGRVLRSAGRGHRPLTLAGVR